MTRLALAFVAIGVLCLTAAAMMVAVELGLGVLGAALVAWGLLGVDVA